MRNPQRNPFREAVTGLCVFALCGTFIACGGGGGGGGGTVTTGTNSTNSTNTTTTSTTTTATTTGTGTSTTGTSTGTLFPDQIFYGIADGNGKTLHRIMPDGSGDQVFATLPTTIPNATVNNAGDAYAFFVELDADPGPNVDIRYNLFRNNSVNTAGALRLTPQNGSNNFWNFLYVGTVQYTPDGTKIIFTAATAENDFGIYSVNAGGGALTRLTSTGVANQYEEAMINLAGDKIVATRLFGGAGEIYTMDITLGGAGVANIVNVSNNAAEDFMPQWSKDGTKIVFSSDRNAGQFDILWMNANGSNVALLAGDARDEYGPSLNNDSTFVAYTILSGDIDQFGLYKKDTVGGLAGSLVLNSGIVQQVYWTPDPPPNRSVSRFGGVQLGRPMRPRLSRP